MYDLVKSNSIHKSGIIEFYILLKNIDIVFFKLKLVSGNIFVNQILKKLFPDILFTSNIGDLLRRVKVIGFIGVEAKAIMICTIFFMRIVDRN